MGRITTLFRLVVVTAPMILGHAAVNAQQASPKGITKLSQMRPLPPKPKPYVIPKGEGDAYVPPPLISNFGKTPSTLNLSGSDELSDPAPYVGAYSPQIEARANRMFPSISQQQEREQWKADQEQRAIANEINRTKPLMYPVSGR
jgi:hypothetical protein